VRVVVQIDGPAVLNQLDRRSMPTPMPMAGGLGSGDRTQAQNRRGGHSDDGHRHRPPGNCSDRMAATAHRAPAHPGWFHADHRARTGTDASRNLNLTWTWTTLCPGFRRGAAQVGAVGRFCPKSLLIPV